jgi:hypothetical protein
MNFTSFNGGETALGSYYRRNFEFNGEIPIFSTNGYIEPDPDHKIYESFAYIIFSIAY